MDKKSILKFKEEIIAVCKKHNISISHEDSQGGFQTVPYNKNDSIWFMEAYVPSYVNKEEWKFKK